MDQAKTGMDISRQVIGLALEVHRQLGPGLLESAYQECLCQELRDANLRFAQQIALPIIYKGRSGIGSQVHDIGPRFSTAGE